MQEPPGPRGHHFFCDVVIPTHDAGWREILDVWSNSSMVVGRQYLLPIRERLHDRYEQGHALRKEFMASRKRNIVRAVRVAAQDQKSLDAVIVSMGTVSLFRGEIEDCYPEQNVSFVDYVAYQQLMNQFERDDLQMGLEQAQEERSLDLGLARGVRRGMQASALLLGGIKWILELVT